jgi:hypothetical protein
MESSAAGVAAPRWTVGLCGPTGRADQRGSGSSGTASWACASSRAASNGTPSMRSNCSTS